MSQLRASDADRERTAERLRAAAGEGRISPDELEERLEIALAARTEAELERVVVDLPALRAYVATSVLLVAIWALTGAGYFWPVWPILGWGLFVLPWTPVGFRPRCHRNVLSRL
jgi:Domain of unknown function (DUF1707)